MKSKTITAIVPNYNYADFIIERIDSILKQTYPVSELIILDDASPDNSVEVIEKKIAEINENYPDIQTKFIKNKVNSGGCVFSQWQKGVKEATGDYIWIAEADDSADEHFLETAMEKFNEHPTAVLFYSDSYRINQDGKILSKTCSDWADMWGRGRWNKDFFNDGVDEVINYLGETNPILNVSSVVWKNQKTLVNIFEEAKEYKVAGDWYIYTRVLEDGDIVYSAKPLNRYRKHDKGSASTVVKLSVEYGEVVKVQERVAKKYNLSEENLKWQKVRRKGMGMVENEKNTGKKGRIAWFVPDFSAGSGGHRTIFQNVNYLVDKGYACDVYIKSQVRRYPVDTYNDIVRWYGEFKGDVFNDYNLARDYDIVFATGWDTAEPVSATNCKNKFYFIQDFEPWFFPMGQEYIGADESYTYGLKGVSIGKWLPVKLKETHNLDVTSFSFCADTNVYKRLENARKENAVCMIFQPGKPRRCSDLGLKALQIVNAVRPDIKIYLYGSRKKKIKYGENIEHLGLLDTKQCNELYNKCKVGLCFSSSNPSRVPFEMMAAGLPVVDIYKENNLYDFPNDGCLLAEPRAESIATAIIKIIDDKALQEKMSKSGEAFMKDYPLERGFEEFGEIVDKIIGRQKLSYEVSEKVYKKKPVVCEDSQIKKIADSLGQTNSKVWHDNPSIAHRAYSKLKRVAKRILYR